MWPEKIGPSQGKQAGRSLVGQQPWIRKERPSFVAVLAMVWHVSYSGFMVQSGEFARHEQLKTSYPFRYSVGHQNWPLPSPWGKKCGGNVGLAPSVHSSAGKTCPGKASWCRCGRAWQSRPARASFCDQSIADNPVLGLRHRETSNVPELNWNHLTSRSESQRAALFFPAVGFEEGEPRRKQDSRLGTSSTREPWTLKPLILLLLTIWAISAWHRKSHRKPTL